MRRILMGEYSLLLFNWLKLQLSSKCKYTKHFVVVYHQDELLLLLLLLL